MATDYVFYDPKYSDGAYRKHPDAVRIVELDWLPVVANHWEPGKEYTATDRVRPLVPTGFAYQAGNSGQSGHRTPRWPTTLGGTIVDGAITWTAISAGANGITTVENPAVAMDPAGELAAADLSVVEETRVRLTLSGGVLDGGSDHVGADGSTVHGYLMTLTVTAGDETLKGSLVIAVVPR